MTIFSPNFAGTVETRKSMTRSSILIEIRPSCGKTSLGDIQPRKNLQARSQRQLNLLGQNALNAQHAVHAQPQHDASFLRLDVDIAGALLDGHRENVVRQADNGRVLGRSRQFDNVGGLFFFALLNLQTAEDFVLQVLEALHRLVKDRGFSSSRPACDLRAFAPFGLLHSCFSRSPRFSASSPMSCG